MPRKPEKYYKRSDDPNTPTTCGTGLECYTPPTKPVTLEDFWPSTPPTQPSTLEELLSPLGESTE